jgi:hypothetical protein
MNASDIVKAKQNRTLYKAYYRPTVFQSSIFSTLYIVSSSSCPGGFVSSISTSYTSCLTQVNKYVCNPTFISYQFAKDVNDGSYECGLKSISKLQWKPQEEIRYLYSTQYTISTISTAVNRFCSTPIISTFNLVTSSVLSTTGFSTLFGSQYKANYTLLAVQECDWTYVSSVVVSSFYITSSIVKVAPQPLICPLVNLYQGTSYLNRCNTCNSFLANDGYCCNQCM